LIRLDRIKKEEDLILNRIKGNPNPNTEKRMEMGMTYPVPNSVITRRVLNNVRKDRVEPPLAGVMPRRALGCRHPDRSTAARSA
jgi:hypothetical protein